MATVHQNLVERELKAWIWIDCLAEYDSLLDKYTLALDNLQGGMFQIRYNTRPDVNPENGVLLTVEGKFELGTEYKICRKVALETVTKLYNREEALQRRQANGGWSWLPFTYIQFARS